MLYRLNLVVLYDLMLNFKIFLKCLKYKINYYSDHSLVKNGQNSNESLLQKTPSPLRPPCVPRVQRFFSIPMRSLIHDA